MRCRTAKNRGGLARAALRLLAVAVITAMAIAGVETVGRSARRPPDGVRPAFDVPIVLDEHAPRGQISNLFGGPGIDRNARIASNGAGYWMVVWHSTDDLGGTVGGDWDIFAAVSRDDGVTWSPARALAANARTDTGDDLSPTIATDGDGVWVVAWSTDETLRGTLGRDRDILFVRSIDDGRTWSDPVPLNVNAASDWGSDREVSITTDGRGRWVAVWSSTDSLANRIGGDSDLLIARSSDGGATWTHPMPLNTNAIGDAAFDTSPEVVADGSGRWVAVWSSGAPRGGPFGPDRDILCAYSTDGGATWSDPAPLNSNAASDRNSDWSPRLASDGRGHWVAVWTSADSLEDAIGVDRDVLVARSSDGGETWSQAAPLNRSAPRDAREDSSPAIATDGRGSWVVTWHAWGALGYGDGSDADIVASYSGDDGDTWTRPVPINPNSRSDVVDDLLPAVATDRTGHWVIAWQGFYPFADVTHSRALWRVVASAGVIEGRDEFQGPFLAPQRRIR